ncbi:vitamin B12-dependent ribonucleoside-diphosphate reductase [Candidatus Methanoplasma termitum]|uniref:Vitamin B12-dependent ribonucleotide reductase n=1 Tax=Candidatus Methanoplasma termitum TaxID=1577791 RepID=A0A0A7LDM3_9ARCH|nr:adenosylcobalamin-dependent ribonucleoside-diphosphate reductase [Candidatus Methanoplasma termitum]AIZ56427.1 vitamin B12-dependent ribonucleoside-diphosphate reductase [Candidatus Methanoplasma termitum]
MEIGEWLGEDNQLGIDIWQKKYCYNGETFEHWLDRVSDGNADIRQMIVEKKFLFGGRILANRGLHKTGLKITLSNCYVVTPPEDSIESIFECAGKLARTFSYGGGVGIDLSKLAPRGAKINNTASETSGAVSFTDLYSMVTGLIGQHGRRGALMLSLSCEHPDLEEFTGVKTDVDRVTKANMSIRVTDEFMDCVREKKNFVQRFMRPETKDKVEKNLNAYEFFKKLCYANWDYGEPGCLFWNRIESWNLLSEFPDYHFAGTNPCAEEPLPAGGSCLLGSMNLSVFVKEGEFDEEDFRRTVGICVRGLNDVLEEGLPLHPLQEQRDSVRDWRQIGLGIMGLADMLIKMELEYGTKEAMDFCHMLGFIMADAAIRESALIAKEKGKFPKCNIEQIMSSPYFLENTSEETRELVKQYGVRNSQLLTIAPTGTLSTMIGISGGIEPIFANSYERRTVSLSDRDEYYKVYTPVVKEYMDKHGVTDEKALPRFFVTAQNLDYKQRLNQQGTWQMHIDASISSTVNLPADFPENEVYDLYLYAWQIGCKGVTVFRDGCKRLGILSAEKAEKEQKKTDEHENGNGNGKKKKRGFVENVADDVVGKKRKLMTGCGSLHCTAFFDPHSGELLEAYLNKGSTGGCNNFMIGLSRMISLAARSGCDINSIVDQLKSCGSCPSYVVRTFTKRDTSKGSCCPMAVGWALLDMNAEMQREVKGISFEAEKETVAKTRAVINPCPKCGDELQFQGGCNICKTCGWTKCD